MRFYTAVIIILVSLNAAAQSQIKEFKIFPEAITIEQSERINLSAVAVKNDGSMFTPAKIMWQPSNAGYLDRRSGWFTAGRKSGDFTVTATYSGMSADVKIKIVHPKVDRLVIRPPKVRVRCNGTSRINFTAYQKNKRLFQITPDWQIPSDALTINNRGVIKAKDKPGTYIVKATVDEAKAVVTVTVSKCPAEHPNRPAASTSSQTAATPPSASAAAPKTGMPPDENPSALTITRYKLMHSFPSATVRFLCTVNNLPAASVIKLFAINSSSKELELQANSVKKTATVYFKSRIDRKIKYLSIRIYDHKGTILASVNKRVK